MSSVLNLNPTWNARNFLNYIKHSFSDTIANWYVSLDEEDKHVLRMMETPALIFKNLYKKIETEFIEDKLDSEEEAREWQRKINSIK